MVIFCILSTCAYIYCSGSESVQLGNHLGNVLVTISDRKKGIADPLNTALIKFFEPVMLSGTDYYPFGMPMRIGGDSSYRYGFNGKENDNEVKGGEGLQQDYGLRIYDPRIGRFLSEDPLTRDYPWYTPYQFAGNDVIRNVDLDGGEPKPATTGKEIEGQATTTTEERIQGRSEKTFTVSQNWVYHEGGVNGSKADWMKAEDYYSDILKPLAKANNEGDFGQKLNFAWTRKDYAHQDYSGMIDNVSKDLKENPTYDHWSRWLPIWGSYKQAELDFSVGKLGKGSFNVGLALSDVFLVKSLLYTPAKAIISKGFSEGMTKYFGIGMSHAYGASVGRWRKLGLDMSGYKHHWLLSQELMKKYPILKPIGNQIWNLTRFKTQASHMRWAHGQNYGGISYPLTDLLYPITSTPSWFKFGLVPSMGGRLIQ